MRFSAGFERSRAKAHPLRNGFSAGLKFSSPLLKQGAPTRFGVDNIGALSSGSHADSLAPALLPLEIRAYFAVAGAEALTFGRGVARLKSCPDTNNKLGPTAGPRPACNRNRVEGTEDEITESPSPEPARTMPSSPSGPAPISGSCSHPVEPGSGEC
jgi:hypothetical protein